MESETSSVAGRPRPWLLVVLALAVAMFLVGWLWPAGSAAPVASASNQQRPGSQREPERTNPADLDIRLEALSVARPGAGSSDRNPFRFRPKAPPPPPPGSSVPARPALPADSGFPVVNGPPPVPPIPLKFIGTVEKQGLKVAAMSDCRSTYYGTEGQVIDGRYRLIRIGVESMVIEYVDGQGRTTVRLEGCPAR
jgi:hypothetical protein